MRGFRGDRCEGSTIFCKDVPGLKKGMALFRNIDAAFETELRTRSPRREIRVGLEAEISGGYTITVRARSEDGREVASSFKADLERADNTERMSALLHEQLSKRSGHYSFRLEKLDVHGTPSGSLPLLSVSTINGIRRLVAEDLDALPCRMLEMYSPPREGPDPELVGRGAARQTGRSGELMRSKYCVRYELGMCPRYQGAADAGRLFLLNNGRRLELSFDCKACEMAVTEVSAAREQSLSAARK